MFKNINDYFIPKIVYIPWIFAYLLFALINLVLSLTIFIKKHKTPFNSCNICIEAGVNGWKSIEFKELYQTACEYVGCNNFIRFEVVPNKSYIEQVKTILKTNKITHYVYDPRTGSQTLLGSLWQSFIIGILLQKKQVVPVVILTDLSIRLWRMQSAIVSARQGVVVSFMSAKAVAPIFPHHRLIGPCLMPLSTKTREMLDQMIKSREQKPHATAIFTGSLYEPRTTILEAVQKGVRDKGGHFKILGRELGNPRVDDIEYWSRLVNADIVFTTSLQMRQKGADWAWIPHLIYRYIEAMASGALFIAQDVPGVRRYFTPSVHFISYENIDDAIEKTLFYLNNHEARMHIARQGKARADALINSRSFWVQIDSSLGKNGLY
jgi:hypothetical protein